MFVRLAACAGVVVALSLTGCAYLGTVVRQSHYRAQLRRSPSPAVYKHLLDRQNTFVFGVVAHDETTDPLAVVALGRTDAGWEVVDVSHAVGANSYYGLNLPPGTYELMAVRDRDRDGTYRPTEVVGSRAFVVEEAPGSEKVIAGIDIAKTRDGAPPLLPAWGVPARAAPPRAESVFFPKGSLRTLDDPLFGSDMASLGLYQPAAFVETAPLMFYALEEDMGYKVPVVFVHGIGGSPRDFEDIIRRLDRSRYRPWFFYYPSGGSLDQVSRLFYEIFLSGRTIPRQGVPMVIVAHSMGGLVVREALNHYHADEHEQLVGALITIGSPLGGHPSARYAVHAPVVIPSWRDLDPSGAFISRLHRTALVPSLAYHLCYTTGDDRLISFGQAGDGVIPLESQLTEAARREARESVGLDAAHVEVLHRDDTVARLVATIETVKSNFPEDHLRVLDQGGYPIALESEFTPLEAYLVHSIGRYMDALVAGEIQPFHPEIQAFVDACRQGTKSDLPAVKAWRKLERLHPDRL